MATPIFSNKSFRRAFLGTTYVFAILQANLLIYWYGLNDSIAWTDSVVHILLLALSAFSVSFCLGYYRPAKGKYVFLLAYCTMQTVMWTALSFYIMLYTFPQDDSYRVWIHQALPVRFVFGWLIITALGIKSLIWYDMEEQSEKLSRKEATERLAREAELYKLRQQLQPHFLFNSLNSINALITLRPQQAREMVLKLSDFLRGTLKREDQQWIQLPEELQYLQWYLDIEKVRFGHRLATEITAEEGTEISMIPPMLLQPVVENAIKYGLYDTTEAITITIHAWMEKDMLFLEVKNPFDAELQQPVKGTGFGLSSISRRLYLLFARHDLLETKAEENIYTTLIKVPQRYDKSSNN
ncbi:sensor histidine kinase [Chitinophaga tropicalis]|uniref:sensor histidine kinase n=1 Tax=Chitinophaga tropicalis TaxID=2683588 RepID=UPI0018DFCB21|nr:histidine kinase [Chitinophaga tropicalis]